MIAYNPKDWIRLILSFHKSDTVRMLIPALIGIALFTSVFVFLTIEVWKMQYRSTTSVHSLLGFVISMLLVFRTNTAYDRWWEGRKLWGSFVNHSRSLSVKLRAFAGVAETEKIKILLQNYYFACVDHLRGRMSTAKWSPVPGEPLDKYTNCDHIPNALYADLMMEIERLRREGKLNDTHLLMLNEELRTLADNLGACERIRSTPIPYSYSMFIKKIIFFYSITMPFAFVSDFRYWTILVVTFIFYAFASLELLAEEIEDPFGEDANDLPTDEIAERIRKHTNEIFKL